MGGAGARRIERSRRECRQTRASETRAAQTRQSTRDRRDTYTRLGGSVPERGLREGEEKEEKRSDLARRQAWPSGDTHEAPMPGERYSSERQRSEIRLDVSELSCTYR